MIFYTGVADNLPMLTRHYRSLVALICEPELSLVQLGGDDWGLYASRLVNDFGTPLMLRGPSAEVDAFLEKHRLPRDSAS